MKDIKFADVAHHYLGCECRAIDGQIYELSPHHFPTNWETRGATHKPLLRSLDSMTEEELKELYSIKPPLLSFQMAALTTHYLLSKHFDLFNLIPSGEAEDKMK